MEGPSEEFRHHTAERIAALERENDVDSLLGAVAELAEVDARDMGPLDEDGAADVLAAVESWAALASNVVAGYYAPASVFRFRGGLAGWAKGIAKHLRKIAKILLTPLQAAASALGADSWSIGVGFPWGVSVSLTWS